MDSSSVHRAQQGHMRFLRGNEKDEECTMPIWLVVEFHIVFVLQWDVLEKGYQCLSIAYLTIQHRCRLSNGRLSLEPNISNVIEVDLIDWACIVIPNPLKTHGFTQVSSNFLSYELASVQPEVD